MPTVNVDGSGRMVIPARIRAELDVGPDGGEVELSHTADGWVLRSAHPPELVRDERGHLVVKLNRTVSTQEILDAIAADRDARG